jgi:hypothetical protein
MVGAAPISVLEDLAETVATHVMPAVHSGERQRPWYARNLNWHARSAESSSWLGPMVDALCLDEDGSVAVWNLGIVVLGNSI